MDFIGNPQLMKVLQCDPCIRREIEYFFFFVN